MKQESESNGNIVVIEQNRIEIDQNKMKYKQEQKQYRIEQNSTKNIEAEYIYSKIERSKLEIDQKQEYK